MFYDIVKALCKERKIAMTSMLRDLGMSMGNVSAWKRGVTPKSDTINKVADFFGVSTDYLLGVNDRGKAIDQAISDVGKELNGYGAMFYGPNGEHVWKEFSSKEEYETYLRLVDALTNKEN